MFLASNIKYLRNYLHLTQADFGKIFSKTRSNIDSYERGNAKPDDVFKKSLADHFGISLEILIHKDIQTNPGILLSGKGSPILSNKTTEDIIKYKDDLIKELRSQIRYLQQQNDSLLDKVGKK